VNAHNISRGYKKKYISPENQLAQSYILVMWSERPVPFHISYFKDLARSSCFVQKFLYFPTVWDMGGAGSISLYVAGFTSSCRRHGCAFCRDKCFRKTWLDDRRKRPGNKAGAKGGTKTSPIHLAAIAVIVFIVIASIISFSSLFLSSSQWHTFLITFKSVVFLYWSWHQCEFCMMINIYNKYNCMPH